MKVLVLGPPGQLGRELMRAMWPSGLTVTGVAYPDFNIGREDRPSSRAQGDLRRGLSHDGPASGQLPAGLLQDPEHIPHPRTALGGKSGPGPR